MTKGLHIKFESCYNRQWRNNDGNILMSTCKYNSLSLMLENTSELIKWSLFVEVAKLDTILKSKW